VSKQYWRLLELGDIYTEGDEISNPVVKWEQVPPSWIGWDLAKESQISRRRITLPEPQGWISVKERMPTKEDANKQGMVLWSHIMYGSRAVFGCPWDHPRPHSDATHWTTIPDDPELDQDADEKAWEIHMKGVKYASAFVQAAAHDAFLAGRKSVATEGVSK
jgi:hypothetical protein